MKKNEFNHKFDVIKPSEKISTYIKIPLELIEPDDSSFDNKRILFYSAITILKHPNISGSQSIFFRPKDILYICGIKTDNRKGGSKDKLNNFINLMESKKYISQNHDYNAYAKVKEYYLNSDIFNPISKYSIITIDEFFYIISAYKEKKINGRTAPCNLLLVLSFLRNYIYNRTSKSSKSETCWRYYTEISDSIGITERSVSECVSVLSDMGIIAYDQAPKYQLPSKQWVNGRTIFANTYRYSKSGTLRTNYSYKDEIRICKHQLALYNS